MLKKLRAWFYYSEFCVAFSGMMLAGFSQVRLENTYDFRLTALVGFGVFFFYTLERCLTLKGNGNPFFDRKLEWQQGNAKLIRFSLFLSLIACLWLIYEIRPKPLSYLAVFIAFLFFMGYSVLASLIPNKSQMRLKAGFATKTLSLISCWLLITLFFPFLETERNLRQLDNQLFFFVFSWLFTNVVIFDSRDVKSDAAKKVKTFPVVFGRFFSLCLLFVFNFATIMTFMSGRREYDFWEFSLILPNILYSLMILYMISYRSRLNYTFYLCVDLVLAVPFLQYLASS